MPAWPDVYVTLLTFFGQQAEVYSAWKAYALGRNKLTYLQPKGKYRSFRHDCMPSFLLLHGVQAPSEKNTLVFKLDVQCRRQGNKVVNEKGVWKCRRGSAIAVDEQLS